MTRLLARAAAAAQGLVPVHDTSESAWWFKGLNWAQPNVQHLRQLMRRVYENRWVGCERAHAPPPTCIPAASRINGGGGGAPGGGGGGGGRAGGVFF